MGNNSKQNLLNQIEKISMEAPRCKLDFSKLIDLKEDIAEVSEFLDLSYNQTILFACLVDLSLQRIVTLESLSRHLKCNALKIINIIHEIDSIEDKKYIQKCSKSSRKEYSYNDIGYTVPHYVIESIRTLDKCKLKKRIPSSLPNLLEWVNDKINERDKNLISSQILLEQVDLMISSQTNHSFIQYINDTIKQPENKCVVLAIAYYRFKRQFVCDLDVLANSIFDDFSDQLEYVQNISLGNNELIKKGILRLIESDFMNVKSIGLTNKTTEILYKHYPDLYTEEESNIGIITPKKIKSKTLYFNNTLKRQIDSLVKVLVNKNFEKFQTKLQDYNLPKGITAIFYGKSGTGKTETAYQIAKKTNRDIMLVDLSRLKSKWFGESEKMVKKVFDDYKRLFDSNTLKPILFINEVDGMFSTRMGISGKNSATDQTVNTIQNIILQELENFDGILFATTNLCENLDIAFERRFLFKVDFESPSPVIRERIWKSKLPELNSMQLKLLSSKYQFSGAEIENVARKYLFDRVIENKQLTLDRLMEFCEREKPFQKMKRIGFHN